MTSETVTNLADKRKAKAELLNDEMRQQTNFFELRAQLYKHLLTVHTWRSPQWVFKRAHEAAKLDFFARVTEAANLMQQMGEEMRIPKSYSALVNSNG